MQRTRARAVSPDPRPGGRVRPSADTLARELLAPGEFALPRRLHAVLLVILPVLSGWLGYSRVEADPGLSDFWLLTEIFTVEVAALGMGVGLRERRLWLRCATIVAGFLVGAVFAGQSVGPALWVGLANLVGGVVAVKLYEWRGLGGSWIPRDPAEARWLLAAGAAGALVTTLLGGYPGTAPIGAGADPVVVMWSWLRQIAFAGVSLNCVTLLYFRSADPPLRSVHPLWWLPYLALSVFCLRAPTIWSELPLEWAVVVPALVAGAFMSTRVAAVMVLLNCVIAPSTPYPDFVSPPLWGVIAPEGISDLIYAYVGHAMMLLLLFRQAEARFADRIREYGSHQRQQYELSDSIVAAMTDGLLLTDDQGRVAVSNDGARQMFGELPATITMEWLTGEATPGAASGAGAAAEPEEPMSSTSSQQGALPGRHEGGLRRSTFVRADAMGTPRRFSLVTQPIDPAEEPYVLWLARDVTAQYDRQQELEAFAGVVAHDLKSPLAAVAGWIEAAQDDLLDDDAESADRGMDRARQAAHRMESLIDDYLAYTVTRGGELALDDVVVGALVDEITAVYDSHEGARFTTRAAHSVHADPALLRQLLANLIGNGMKYTREGSPADITVTTSAGEPGWIEVSVSDRGRGLPPGTEETVFSRYDRAGAESGAVQGIGLGLALCADIVERHGGRIWAQNNEWGGASFHFTLPAADGAGR